jgi:Iap family predicted aminopeptidase
MFLLGLLKDCVVGRVVVDGDKDDFVSDNFTKVYRTICHFEIRVLHYQTSQTSVSKFPNVSLEGFAVKSCQKSQNRPYFFRGKKC